VCCHRWLGGRGGQRSSDLAKVEGGESRCLQDLLYIQQWPVAALPLLPAFPVQQFDSFKGWALGTERSSTVPWTTPGAFM
jgi:hypothetical protein